MPKAKVTPARRQYLDFKAQYPDAVVFFRMGDFYECFDDDAELVARELDITLTARSNTRNGEKIPMAGVPHHAVDNYVARLVEKGYHVAVVDQMGSDTVNGIVPREVTQVVTPGTITEPSMLDQRQNNFLLGIVLREGTNGYDGAGIAYVDITTGQFAATQVAGEEAPIKLLEEITRLSPREVIMPQSWAERGVTLPPGSHLTPYQDFYFDTQNAEGVLLRHFKTRSLAGFGLDDLPLAVQAAGGVLQYLIDTQRGSLAQIKNLRTYSTSDFMNLDTATRRNLELTATMRGGGTNGSLLSVLDRTVTPMGARLLRQWVGQPVLDMDRLNARLDAVEALYNSGSLRAEVIDILRSINDIERLTNRLLQKRILPRELIALADTLRKVPALRVLIQGITPLEYLYTELDPADDATYIIDTTLTDEPPAVMNTIGTIRKGISAELDDIYNTSRDARNYINTLEKVEKERTGLKTLKVGYNKVFGYYIEISRALSDQAPDHYIRKQTLVNAERFITPEMKDKENIIMNADDRLLELERQLYDDLLNQLQQFSTTLLRTARAIAHLDGFTSLAEVAIREDYTRPTLTHNNVLHIEQGRHPVVEQTLPAGTFMPNDCFFDEHERIHLVTGPNMAGKSTTLRQTALIVLMAQLGSFVPAHNATIGLVDRIFTRVGAQDEIHAGQSTFMVEMVETANILTHATPRSLVILDEIGRGTSTYDGMAIARAVIEYLHNNPRLGCKTMFATHYHELTTLEDILPKVRNYNVAVGEHEGEITFLHQVHRGAASQSYGVHVARLAGVPQGVVNRANELLSELEAQGSDFKLSAKPDAPHQISMFDDTPNPALEALQQLNIDQLTPIDAITKLYELKRIANNTD